MRFDVLLLLASLHAAFASGRPGTAHRSPILGRQQRVRRFLGVLLTGGLLNTVSAPLTRANALERAPPSPFRLLALKQSGVSAQGLLRPCEGACLSSQDDTPAYFIPPLCYDGPSYQGVARRLVDYLQTKVPNAMVVSPAVQDGTKDEPNRYIRVLVKGPGNVKFADELEFYFTPNDNTIQFRLQHLEGADFGGVNRQRIQDVVKSLQLDYVPVLRNRRQVWWSFGLDTPFDEFGPGDVEWGE